MSRIGIGYDIGRFTGVCASTGEALEPGSPCVATLAEPVAEDGTPGDGFVRQDFSPSAWEAGHRPPRLFSFWRTTVPHPDAPKRLLVDDTVLLDLLTRLEGDDRSGRLAFRFVLALILLRRRRLRQVGRERTTVMAVSRTGLAADPGADSADGATAGSEIVGDVPPAVREPMEVDVWLLVPRGAAEGEPPLRVIDPRLGPDDVAAITEQLDEVLSGEG